MIPQALIRDTAYQLMATAAIEIPDDYLAGIHVLRDREEGQLSGFVLDANPIRPSTITRSAEPLLCRELISLSRFASKITGVSSDSTRRTSTCWTPRFFAASRIDSISVIR